MMQPKHLRRRERTAILVPEAHDPQPAFGAGHVTQEPGRAPIPGSPAVRAHSPSRLRAGIRRIDARHELRTDALESPTGPKERVITLSAQRALMYALSATRDGYARSAYLCGSTIVPT